MTGVQTCALPISSIYNYWSLAADPIGNVYFYNWTNYRIRKIDTAGIITTIAGNGSMGVSGDGGPATAASIGSSIYGVAADAYGNVYFADWSNGRVRMINSSGIITTVAGNGATGSTGNGGPATAAQIGQPISVAVDLAGNINIADWLNDNVRKVNAAGIISTVAGTGTFGFNGGSGLAGSYYDAGGGGGLGTVGADGNTNKAGNGGSAITYSVTGLAYGGGGGGNGFVAIGTGGGAVRADDHFGSRPNYCRRAHGGIAFRREADARARARAAAHSAPSPSALKFCRHR